MCHYTDNQFKSVEKFALVYNAFVINDITYGKNETNTSVWYLRAGIWSQNVEKSVPVISIWMIIMKLI